MCSNIKQLYHLSIHNIYTKMYVNNIIYNDYTYKYGRSGAVEKRDDIVFPSRVLLYIWLTKTIGTGP